MNTNSTIKIGNKTKQSTDIHKVLHVVTPRKGKAPLPKLLLELSEKNSVLSKKLVIKEGQLMNYRAVTLILAVTAIVAFAITLF